MGSTLSAKFTVGQSAAGSGSVCMSFRIIWVKYSIYEGKLLSSRLMEEL